MNELNCQDIRLHFNLGKDYHDISKNHNNSNVTTIRKRINYIKVKDQKNISLKRDAKSFVTFNELMDFKILYKSNFNYPSEVFCKKRCS